MKKQLLLLSLSLLLASCGGTSVASQSVEQSESDSVESSTLPFISEEGGDSTPAEEKTRAEILADLFETLAETGQCTYTDPGNASTHYLGGDKGMLYVLDSSKQTVGNPIGYGISKLPNYGLVSYYYQNDTAGVDASSAEIVSPNKNISFEDYDNSVKELGEIGKDVTFSESGRTHVFSTTDEDFVNAILALDGMTAAIGLFPTLKATISLSDDGKDMTVGYVLDGSTVYNKISYQGMVISNIGTAKNKNVEDFIASNPTISKPTAWDADTLEVLNSIDPSINLPFPAGATYAASMPLSADDNGIVTLFRDFGSGNISNAYGTALLGAGFTAEPEFTDAEAGLVGFSKQFEGSGMKGDTTIYIILSFETATGEMATFYPNGIFSIYAMVEAEPAIVTETELNNHLAQFKLDWAPSTNVFPTLSFGANCTKIEAMDQTQEVEDYFNQTYGSYLTFDCVVSLAARAFYATEAEAAAFCEALGTSALALGYVADDQTEGTWNLSNNQSDYLAMVVAVIAENETTGAYEGYVDIELDYYSIVY